MIVSMEPWHLMSVVMRAEKLDLLGEDPQRWACARALEPGLAFSVINSASAPVACFGFHDDAAGICSAWMVTTSGWRCYVKSVAKVFKLVARSGDYRRIQAYVEPERDGAAKFLKWLGFKLDGPLPKMRADGRQMDLYSYT